MERITSNLAREAILAAIKDQTESARSVRKDATEMFQSALEESSSSEAVRPTADASDSSSLMDGVREIDGLMRSAEPDRMAHQRFSLRENLAEEDFFECCERLLGGVPAS